MCKVSQSQQGLGHDAGRRGDDSTVSQTGYHQAQEAGIGLDRGNASSSPPRA
jgi:hypothetical protein